MAAKGLSFPEINPAFENSTSLNEVCIKYINILNETQKFHNTQYSNRLTKFLEVENNIEYLETEYNALKAFLRKWSKENNVHVIIKMRRKSFIGYNEKIRLYLLNGRDISLIRDLIGFRLILVTGPIDTIDTHKLCYKLMNDILSFFALERKYLLLDAEKSLTQKNTLASEEIANKIFISDVDDILPEFKKFVENYVRYPKPNDGYQGLHACVESRLPFEIQIKSFAMDSYAEQIHSTYKEHRYKQAKFSLDLSKINLNGVYFDETGKILSDYSGLFKGLDLFNRS